MIQVRDFAKAWTAPPIAAWIVVIALAVSFFATPAMANPSLLVDVASGRVLQAEEATKPWHPASTAKLMTVYVALQAVKQGRLSLDTPLNVTRRAAAQRPSKIGIRPGQIITLDNALKILLVKSANDLAYVIGEAVGGNAEAFIAQMNQHAARLGMRESHFTNPNGWHDPGQQVSARDLAILALALWQEFPEYREYWGIGSVQLGNKIYKNTNGLIGRYEGAIGMKTGFVCASGFNVVALATRNGRTLLAVILGAASGKERTLLAAQLLDQGFSSYSRGSSLQQLPESDITTASSIRNEVCGRNRRAPLTEEDVEGSISAQAPGSSSSDSDSIYATLREQTGLFGSAPANRVTQPRYGLGERYLGDPLPVFLGRAPGNADPVFNHPAQSSAPAAIARRPAINTTATGYAPVQAGIAGRSAFGSIPPPRAGSLRSKQPSAKASASKTQTAGKAPPVLPRGILADPEEAKTKQTGLKAARSAKAAPKAAPSAQKALAKE